jgi:sugar lactone lactonase YvrE
MGRFASISLLTLATTVGLTVPAAASGHADQVIVLPGISSTEGIAAGPGTTFYAGDAFRGDIFRGDLRQGTAELFIDAPDGRFVGGVKADVRHHLLFAAGGPGHAYVYDTGTRTTVAAYDVGDPATTFVNDVALVPGGAWFTDSLRPNLYFVPVSPAGRPGPLRTLRLSGPAADTSGQFNLNGIQATPTGRTLIVGHTGLGKVFTVNPVTGASAELAGVDAPNNDGLVLSGHRLWVVQNFSNQISEFRLGADFSRGSLDEVITSPAFGVPTTAALFGDRLAAVNSHFDTGVPPTATRYEVVVVHA